MSDFLTTFMFVAKDVTRADRCMALDRDLALVASDNVNEDLLKDDDLSEVIHTSLSEALESGESVYANTPVSNEIITATYIPDLRIMVAIPLPDHGVIYLDQPIRQGPFPRETVERLRIFGNELIAENNLSLDRDELATLYNKRS